MVDRRANGFVGAGTIRHGLWARGIDGGILATIALIAPAPDAARMHAFGLPDRQVVEVTNVDLGSVGCPPQDLIVAINGVPMKATEDVVKPLVGPAPGAALVFSRLRRGARDPDRESGKHDLALQAVVTALGKNHAPPCELYKG